jgi:hypothetical protein
MQSHCNQVRCGCNQCNRGFKVQSAQGLLATVVRVSSLVETHKELEAKTKTALARAYGWVAFHTGKCEGLINSGSCNRPIPWLIIPAPSLKPKRKEPTSRSRHRFYETKLRKVIVATRARFARH